MTDTLEIFGDEFTNVTGIKATDDNGVVQRFHNYPDGDNLGYGITDGTLPIVGVGKVGSAEI